MTPPTVSSTPLLLVDGHNLLWRAAYGFPAQIRSRDKARDLTAVFGFFALLRVAIHDEFPTPPEVIVVFDGQDGANARKTTNTDYKANRPADASALAPILALADVQRGLDTVGMAWIEIDDAEADDVIATLAAHTEPHRPVVIMSGDRDFYQLLDHHVRVLNTAKHRGKRYTGPDEVFADFGITPTQWACYRALVGDPADNIPGVRGVGAVAAAQFLTGGLSLDDLPHSGRLTGAKGHAVTATWEQAIAWRDVIRLRTDIRLPTKPTGQPSPAMPKPADVIQQLDLW